MLALDLLGPVLLRRQGAAWPLSVKKTQALLVLLACEGRTPRGRLAACLWPDLDEPTGRRNLRRELARLREAGLADMVQADGDFLALAPAVDCDVARFEQALQDQRPDDALALWRGPPADGLNLDDGPFGDWLAGQRERLQAGRRRALQASAMLHEARGALDVALLRIEGLLADDLLQERHHRDAMRLLAAVGRREAALAQYARCCAVLQSELGLQPMAETVALAASLRTAGAPTASAPVPSSAPVPAAGAMLRLPETLPFVGRAAEVAVLEAAWRAGDAVLIEGEGGVGKTRLALDFLTAHGACALARCRPGDAELPYAAFTRALRALAGPTPDLTGLPGWAVDELARLLPEIGPAPPPLRSGEERGRFFEACAQAWSALSADNFDAVLLDDWHHADSASLALLVFVAQRRRDAGSGGAREWLLLRPEPGTDAVRRLVGGLQARHLRLQPLDDVAVFDLVQQLSGAERPARFAARLQQATEGNPFFVAETLHHWVAQRWLAAGADGVWRTAFDDATQDYRELPVPASVRDAVLARVQRLGMAGQRVLEAAALAAEPFSPGLLAPACALSELDTVLAIEQAVQARLLREHDAGGFAFAHDLVQQSLEATLGADRRRLVHRRLALGAEAAAAPAALVATHFEASGERRRAVPHRLVAGEQALRLHALPEAVAHWQRALDDDPTPSQQRALHLALMRTTRWLDQSDASMRHADDLQALVATGQLSEAERAEVLIAVARALAQGGRAAESLALLDDLPPTLDERQQAQAMAARVDALRESGRVVDAADAARAALALPGLQGRDRADLLDSLVLVEQRAGRLHEALAWAEASLALCRQLGDEFGISRGSYRRGSFLTELGDLPGAEAELRQGVAHCVRLGTTANRLAMLYGLSCVYRRMGRAADQLAAANEGWALLSTRSPPLLRLVYRLAAAQAHFALGALGAAWTQLLPAVDELLALGPGQRIEAAAEFELELFAWLGARPLADRLQAGIEGELAGDSSASAQAWWLARCELATVCGDATAARYALARLPAVLHGDTLRQRAAVAAAALALAEGDARPALSLRFSDDTAEHGPLEALGLALQIRAQTAQGALQAGTLAAAQASLGTEGLHAHAALALHLALAAAQRARVPGVSAVAAQQAAAWVASLAASLAEFPAQRAAFLRVCG